eukprot:1029052-Pyramimonas_sp.AAC.1
MLTSGNPSTNFESRGLPTSSLRTSPSRTSPKSTTRRLPLPPARHSYAACGMSRLSSPFTIQIFSTSRRSGCQNKPTGLPLS